MKNDTPEKTPSVQFRLAREHIRALDKEAKQLGMSRAGLIARIIRDRVVNYEDNEARARLVNYEDNEARARLEAEKCLKT